MIWCTHTWFKCDCMSIWLAWLLLAWCSHGYCDVIDPVMVIHQGSRVLSLLYLVLYVSHSQTAFPVKAVWLRETTCCSGLPGVVGCFECFCSCCWDCCPLVVRHVGSTVTPHFLGSTFLATKSGFDHGDSCREHCSLHDENW